MIFGVENEPPAGSDRGVKFSLFIPFVCATAIQSDSLFLCTRQKARNIPDLEEVISGQQRLHIHTKDAFRLAKAKDSHICREILMTADCLFG